MPDPQRPAHEPVQHGGLPFDEGFILGDQGGATKYHDDAQTDPLHGFDKTVLAPQPGNLCHRGHDGHSGGRIDAIGLENDKEQNDGKEIKKNFHGA